MLLQVLTPEGVVLSEDVKMVVLPGKLGLFGVLDGHENMVIEVTDGIMAVTLDGYSHKRYEIEKGFVDISGEKCTVLTKSLCSRDECSV